MQYLIKLHILVVIFTTTIYGENPMEIIITSKSINWLSILLPITTMLIVVVGFLITRKQLKSTQKLALENIRIEVLSKNRQDWINTLRDELSNYIGKLNEYRYLNKLDDIEELTIKDVLIIKEVTTIVTKIELLLNPTEKTHQDLIKLIKNMNKNIQTENEILSREKFIEYSQKILKEEWERVKKGN